MNLDAEDLAMLELVVDEQAYHKLDPTRMVALYDKLEDDTPHKLAVETYFRYLIALKAKHDARMAKLRRHQPKGPRHTKPKRR